MNSFELKTAFYIGLLFATRMFGLFVILPVFTPYAENLPHSNALLIGLALGIYGFTQAFLQMPFGWLSDRYGRKPIIVSGLIIFILGSLIAAWSDSIIGIIIGRALQGAGAIGSTLMALASDLIRPQERSKAMGIIGISISLALFCGLGLSPLLNEYLSVPGLFWITACFASIGLIIITWYIPSPIILTERNREFTFVQRIKMIVSDSNLMSLNTGVFFLHASLTALFLVLPIKLIDLHVIGASQWQLLLLPLLFGFFTMLPFINWADKTGKLKTLLIGSVSLLLIGLLVLVYANTTHTIFIGLWAYFTAFTLLEANLPAQISRYAPENNRGTSLGTFTSCQFFGMFFGGVASGWIYQYYGMINVFLFAAFLCIMWLLIVSKVRYSQN